MAFISLLPHGVVVTKAEKQQQLWLSYLEWEAFCNLRESIDPYMKGECPMNEHYWNLPHESSRDDDVNVRAVYNRFEGGCYLHLRVYVNSTPTKQGVMFNRSNWHSIQTAMGVGKEVTLAREVYMYLLKEQVTKSRLCEGCENGWGSQRDHTCMMGDEPLTFDMARKLPPVDIKRFIAELANVAKNRDHILERPVDCYRLHANFLHGDMLKQLVLEGIKEGSEQSNNITVHESNGHTTAA
jgi:hypothetical protein